VEQKYDIIYNKEKWYNMKNKLLLKKLNNNIILLDLNLIDSKIFIWEFIKKY